MKTRFTILLIIFSFSIAYSQIQWLQILNDDKYPIYHQDSSITFSAKQTNFFRNIYSINNSLNLKVKKYSEVVDSMNVQIESLIVEKSIQSDIIQNQDSQIENLNDIIRNKSISIDQYNRHVKVCNEQSEKINSALKKSRVIGAGLGVGVAVLLVALVL